MIAKSKKWWAKKIDELESEPIDIEAKSPSRSLEEIGEAYSKLEDVTDEELRRFRSALKLLIDALHPFDNKWWLAKVEAQRLYYEVDRVLRTGTVK